MSSLANWQGNFKRRYGSFINPLPSDNTIAEFAKFVQQDRRPGENYNFPVKVGNEHGQTPNVDGTAFSLSPAVDSQLQNAQLDGATLALIGNVPYDVAFKSNNGAGDGSNGGAFMRAFDLKIQSLMESMEFYRELSLLYGCGTAAAAAANIGVVNASISGANLAAPQVVNITRATWAPGIWNMMTNGLVDVYQSNGTTLRDSGVTVQAIVATTARVTLFKAASAVVVAANDVIVPQGWRTKTCYGLQALLENTGTILNINAALYPSWQALNYNVGGALGRAKLLQFCARLYPTGARGGGKLFVNGMTFAELAEEADALQRYTGNTDEVKRQGVESLQYKSPIGTLDVAVHSYLKQGIAMFFKNGAVKRVGSTDVTFRGDGPNDWFFLELPSNAGYQLRVMSNQAPVIETPYHSGILTGITNTGDVMPA
jgi:hypothetical protein